MAAYEVLMSGGGDYVFRIVYEATPQSGGVLVTATSQWLRRSGSGSGTYNGAAPYYITLGGYGTKSGTVAFNGADSGWRTIVSTSQFFVSGDQVVITATFNTDTSGAGSGSITLPVPLAIGSQATFAPSDVFEAGSPVTINTNRTNPAYTHDITYEFGSATGTAGTGVGASAAWTPPLSMLTAIPNLTQATGSISVTTKNGATVVGVSTTRYTLKAPASVVPTISAVSVQDQNTTVASLIGKPVQGLSTLKFTVTSAGVQGSTITERTVTFLGATFPSGDQIAASSAGTLPVIARTVDSRGRAGTWSGSVQVLAYAPPSVTAYQARRCNATGVLQDDGEHLRIDLTCSASSLVNGTEKNALTITVKTRPGVGGAETTRNIITPGLTHNGFFVVSGGAQFTNTASWGVRVEVADKLTTAIVDTTVATASTALDLYGTKVGVGKTWERGALDVAAGGIYDNGSLVINASNVASEAARGIVELATQSEVNAGTDTARAVTPKALRDRAYAPFSMAAGQATTSTSAAVTVTFPAGRFTHPPRVSLTPLNNTNVSVPYMASNPTASSMQIRAYALNSAVLELPVDWVAVQMTSTGGSG